MAIDPAKLKAAAPHVAHDIRMLRESWHSHAASPFAWTAWFIHTRSVMDFVDGRGKHADDVRARDYLESGRWESIAAAVSKPADYEDYRNAVHKLAAHLTYTRIQYAESGRFVPSRSITEFLLGQTHLFLRHLPDDRVSWFGGLL
jgi:hypothetical protein